MSESAKIFIRSLASESKIPLPEGISQWEMEEIRDVLTTSENLTKKDLDEMDDEEYYTTLEIIQIYNQELKTQQELKSKAQKPHKKHK